MRIDIATILEVYIDQLADKISDMVIQKMNEENHTSRFISSDYEDKSLITTDELIERFSISQSTILKLRKQGMPYLKIGDSVRFEPNQIIKFLKENNHE